MKFIKFIIISSMLFLLPLGANATPEGSGIVSISHSPTIPDSFGNITITMEFTDASNVSRIRLTYCRMTPDYLCHFPSYTLEATENDPNVYSVEFTLKDDSESIIGYRFYVDYTDDSSKEFPESQESSFTEYVMEPDENIFYYAVDIGYARNTEQSSSQVDSTSENSTQSTSDDTSLLFSGILVSLFTIVHLKKKYY